MALYAITYDLNKPGQNYKDLINVLAGWGAKRALLSFWVLRANSSSAAIRDALTPHIDQNDRLFVAEITNWATFNSMIDVGKV